MSIIRLKNSEIDPKAWDNLVEKCPQSRIFSKYDYLNGVNHNFEAVVEIKNDQYVQAFPLSIKRRYGFDYIVQPVFTQQLQILSQNGSVSDEFLANIKKELSEFFSIRLSVDLKSGNLLQQLIDFRSINRVTYILELNKSNYEGAYSKNHKRNIKSAGKEKWTLDINNDFEGMLEGFKQHKGKDLEISKNFFKSYNRLIPFFKSSEEISVFSALDQNGNTIASALFAGHKNVMTFLLSYSSTKAKKSGIMHSIINMWLLNHSAGYKSLDFEGGNISSLGRFYSGFGAVKIDFAYLEKHRFPFGYFMK